MHPDRTSGATPAERALAERRMREINEAWDVLQDPERRRRYDLGRAVEGSSSSGRGAGRTGARASRRPPATAVAPVDEDLVDVLPPMTGLQAGLFRHLPWVVLVLVFGAIFVLSAYASGGGGDDGAPSRTAVTTGSCLDLLGGTSTTIVSCDGPHEARVVDRVLSADQCPQGTDPRRLAADGLFDCLTAS